MYTQNMCPLQWLFIAKFLLDTLVKQKTFVFFIKIKYLWCFHEFEYHQWQHLLHFLNSFFFLRKKEHWTGCSFEMIFRTRMIWFKVNLELDIILSR